MEGVLFVFYEQLKKACKEKGTSVTATLKKIGVGTANGTYWKNGSVPSSDIVIQLAEFLDVSTDYLLIGKEAESKTTVILSDIEEKLINDFRNLSPQGQDYIRQQMFMAREVYKKQDLPQADLNAG